MPESRLLLLDGHSLAYRAFYALPVENFSTTTGQPTNAVFGFTSMLINVLRDERPTHVAVAFDVSRQTFRTESFPEYKANRASSPAEFAGQVDLIREILVALGIPVLSIEGYEADDIIATLVRRSADRDMSVDIVTGDRDAFQLVSDRVTVLYPVKGVSDLARMTPEAVEAKYGLSPAQYPDYAALRGDPSDNLPGIPGVGEKTASKWIREYGSLADLVDHVDQVGGKVGDALRASLPQVLVNRHLTQLVDDVPVPLDLDEAVLAPWDRAAVDRLFDTLQFRALRERLDKVRPASGDEADAANAADAGPERADAEILALAGPDAASWLAGAQGVPAAALAGTWTRGRGHIDAAAVIDDRGVAGYLDCADPAVAEALLDWLADPAAPKDLHDAKGAALALVTVGRTLAGVRLDTALAAYLEAPGHRGYGLADVAQRILGVSIDVGTGGDQLLFDTGHEAAEGLAREAGVVRQLAADLGPRLDAQGVRHLLTDLELPLVPLLAQMEHAGIAVDLPGLQALSSEFGADMRRVGGGRPGARRPALQPRLAQAAAGDPVRRAQPAEDEEDQDRLHDRRRGPAAALRPDRRPAARAAARVARPVEAAADRRRAHPAGRLRAAASTPASTRWSPRPAACRAPTPTCRTSRSAPTPDAGSVAASSSARATRPS